MTDIKNSDQSAPLLNQQDNSDGKNTQNDVVANATSSPPVSSQQSRTEINQQWKYRFEVTALSLASLMLATCVMQTMATSSYSILRIVALPCTLFLAFFIYQWIVYFSDGLTRRKRAFFDVKNLLQTYQPNRNTDKARLFAPDPPTPNVLAAPPSRDESRNKLSKQDNEQKGTEEAVQAADRNKQFSDWRKQHYQNEYLIAMQAQQGAMSLYDPSATEETDGEQTAASENPTEQRDSQQEQSVAEDSAPKEGQQGQEKQPQPPPTE